MVTANFLQLATVSSTLTIKKINFVRKNILKTLPAKKILSSKQVQKIELTTKFAPKFCGQCIKKYSSPELFQECQNKLCERVQFVQANLEPDLEFFQKLQAKQFKICKTETATFCQFCREADLSEAEIRLLNQLVDRTLKGKSVALFESQRTRRAINFGEKLTPRALAVFPVVSENVESTAISNTELCSQLSIEIQNTKLFKEKQVPSRTTLRKYRAYDKIEVSLSKQFFQE